MGSCYGPSVNLNFLQLICDFIYESARILKLDKGVKPHLSVKKYQIS